MILRSLLIVATSYVPHEMPNECYWVATVSRLLKITGLFCKRALQKRLYSAKETYHFPHEMPNECTIFNRYLVESHGCVMSHTHALPSDGIEMLIESRAHPPNLISAFQSKSIVEFRLRCGD